MSGWDKVLGRTQSGKSSAISVAESRAFVNKVKKLEGLDDTTRATYKDAKLLNEAVTGLQKCEHKLVAELYSSPAVQAHEEMKSQMNEWMQSEQEFQEDSCNQATHMQKALVDPLRKLKNVFPDVQTAIKKREACLLEYNKWRLKVEKYQGKERTGQNAVKLESYKGSLATAKEDFETVNSILSQALPDLYADRVQYLEPSIKALMTLQLEQYSQGYKKYTELHHGMTPTSKQMQQERFAELKSLSIVSPD